MSSFFLSSSSRSQSSSSSLAVSSVAVAWKKTFRLCVGLVLLITQLKQTHAWVSTMSPASTSTMTLTQQQQQQHRCSLSGFRSGSVQSNSILFESIASADGRFAGSATKTDDDEEEEWEEVELEILTESDFYGSEWLVGSVMDKRPNKIVETWVRLATDNDGKNVAIWGDNAQGTWSFDVANQFLSFSKQSLFGKAIWAGVVDDYYFTLGTIRGYNMWSAAAVLGQWQAKRLGVEPGEAGVAPWFQEQEEEDGRLPNEQSSTEAEGTNDSKSSII